MTRARDLLIEIGTEELPPRALRRLGAAFGAEIENGLKQSHLGNKGVHWYATPRRLAVIVNRLTAGQDDHEVIRRGPALTAAFDASGKPTPAAEGFARSCQTSVDRLEKLETDKGSWLISRSVETGKRTAELLPGIIEQALAKLPIPKRMRWGDRQAEFIRPVHWSVVLHGDEVIPCTLLDTTASHITYGHRFHHPRGLKLRTPRDYLKKLRERGRVIADFNERRDMIREMVNRAAAEHDGNALLDDDLLDEVTALVEWPVVIVGSFEDKFLELPREMLVATMQGHQKYFPLVDPASGHLLNRFITIANIDSHEPARIRMGNEKVIRPRLTDAAFFWHRDRSQPLATRVPRLQEAVFQKQLGTLADKTGRVTRLAGMIAGTLGFDRDHAQRAAELSRCDLFSEMVGEFPELQGIMGRYLAGHDGESEEVATALDEMYMPRHAGDRLPETRTGQVLALADRLDTLVGIFGIGQFPTGDKDPFALRRAAIGILRILEEHRLPLDLAELLETAQRNYADGVLHYSHDQDGKSTPNTQVTKQYLIERARHYLREQGYGAAEVEAVLALYPGRPAEYRARLDAVREFMNLPEAAALAEADKRIRNIISKSAVGDSPGAAREELMQESPERQLLHTTRTLREQVDRLIVNGEFRQALILTAGLHGPVTEFFDKVMVNSEDAALRQNRFALLHEVAGLTNRVADISRLAG